MSTPGAEPTVHAAGGVVWRSGACGLEVLLVHRPAYDDWTFPKGKRDPGEDDETCARREVEEETGYRCSLGAELPSTRYVDAKGRDKVVRYWAMTVEAGEGEFAPGEETDALDWRAVADVPGRLTYAHDVAVLDGLVAHLGSA